MMTLRDLIWVLVGDYVVITQHGTVVHTLPKYIDDDFYTLTVTSITRGSLHDYIICVYDPMEV